MVGTARRAALTPLYRLAPPGGLTPSPRPKGCLSEGGKHRWGRASPPSSHLSVCFAIPSLWSQLRMIEIPLVDHSLTNTPGSQDFSVSISLGRWCGQGAVALLQALLLWIILTKWESGMETVGAFYCPKRDQCLIGF